MESLEWRILEWRILDRVHLGILSWREAHGSRGRKGEGRPYNYGISWVSLGGGGGGGVELLGEGGGGGASPATHPLR